MDRSENKYRTEKKKKLPLCGSKHSFIVHLHFLYWSLHHFTEKLRGYCNTGYLGITGVILRSSFFQQQKMDWLMLKSHISLKRWLWISPKREIPLPAWAACASTWPPSQSKSVCWCSDGASSVQFMPFASCPVTGHQWKESGAISSTPSLQVFAPCAPSLLQAKQFQLSQTVLIGKMLQSLNCLCGPSVYSLQY